GYSYAYIPWYQWWVWRPWWTDRGGVRAALIDNIYNRWSGDRVIHHDRPGTGAARASQLPAFSGYPALYGRFKGSSRPAALTPPANTVALNPYLRPQTPPRSGEVPRGAQLLSTLRQSPGGGRDLYASPDGNIYQRRNDGWYQRQGGAWKFFAPTQGSLERNQLGNANGRGDPGSYRLAANDRAGRGNPGGRGDRVPNVGNEARSQEVRALEREYYARALSQMRAGNSGRGTAMR